MLRYKVALYIREILAEIDMLCIQERENISRQRQVGYTFGHGLSALALLIETCSPTELSLTPDMAPHDNNTYSPIKFLPCFVVD